MMEKRRCHQRRKLENVKSEITFSDGVNHAGGPSSIHASYRIKKGNPAEALEIRMRRCRDFYSRKRFCDAQSLANFSRGCGLIEGVEVDASDAVVEEIGALLCRVVEADLADGGRRVARALKGLEQLGREARSSSEFRHPFHRGKASDRHDSSDDGHLDSRENTAIAEVVEVVVVKKKLGADVVRAGVHLGFEMIHFEEAVWRGGMPFRKARNTDSKATLVWMTREFFDETNQVGSLGKSVARVVVVGLVAGRIASEGENVAHASGSVAFEDRGDFGLGMADASEVRNGIERRSGFEPEDEFVGEFAR